MYRLSLILLLLAGCSTYAHVPDKTKQLPPDNSFTVDLSYQDTWRLVAQSMRKHTTEADINTGVIQTEKIATGSDLYRAYGDPACEVFSWVVLVSGNKPTTITVERSIDVYDASSTSIACRDVLSQTKTRVLAGGYALAANAPKSTLNPHTSYKLENAGAAYLKAALTGGVPGSEGRLPLLKQ